jgi:signal peptide peptidase SppA
MYKRILKLVPPKWRKKTAIINVIRLEGTIVAGKSMRGGSINAKDLEPVLKKAFQKGIAGVALQINSPGGSPVQSALIGARIRALSTKHEVPVYAFCEDVAASGGYWLACAADEIYADESSIIGSIGVISAGFGLVGTMKKLGAERRVYTAGESKSVLDPFQPEKKEDVARIKALQLEIHESFKRWVRARRGVKLKENGDLFTGAFWVGATAKELGLVDDLGHMNNVLQRKFGDRVDIRLIDQPRGWGLGLLGLGGAKGFGGAKGLGAIAELPDATLSTLEDRSLWARFGL